MNEQFANFTTNIAFAISLSRVQCNALLRVAENAKEGLWMHDVGTMYPLERRGLVFWHRDDAGKVEGFGGLTEAGRLMVALLKEAGLTIDATNTARVLARIGRDAA